MEKRKRTRKDRVMDMFDRIERDSSDSDSIADNQQEEEYSSSPESSVSDMSDLTCSEGESEEQVADDDDFEYEQYNIDEQDYSTQETDYRLLAYVSFVCSEGLSAGTTRRLDSLMEVLYGTVPPFQSSDVQRILRKEQQCVLSHKIFYCNGCGLRKNKRNSTCLQCRTHTLLNTTTIVIMDAKFQLGRVISKYGHSILQAHSEIHEGKMNSFESDDIRAKNGYMEEMETKEEFMQNQINLIVTVSSDGARFKRLSKREVTPMLLRVEGLSKEEKTGGGVFVLLSMTFADGGLKKGFVDEYVTQSLKCVDQLQMTLQINDLQWTFRLVFMGALLDMKEQKSLTQLPNWFQSHGCSQCLTRGTKKRNGKMTYSNPEDFPLRSDEHTIRCAARNEYGFTDGKIPKIFKYIAPRFFVVDPFHIKSLGVCKEVLNELVHPVKWQAKLLPGKNALLHGALNSIKPYTYDPVPLGSLAKVTKCTGREIEKLSVLVCAIISWTESCQSSDYNAFLLGMYHLLFFTGGTLACSGSLRKLMNSMYELHTELARESITLKFHAFYKHVQSHEENYGFLYTTEPFEREHKFFMTSMHCQTTNCENALPTRYTAGQFYRRAAMDVIPSLSQPTRIAVQNCMKRRCGRNAVLTESNEFSHTQLTPAHSEVAYKMGLPENTVFRKRISVSSRLGHFTIAAKEYWQTNNTSQSVICWINSTDQRFRYGEIQFIFDNCSYVKELILEPFQVSFAKLLSSRSLSLVARRVIEDCTYFPVTFGKVGSIESIIINNSQILAPSSLIVHDNAQYIELYR